METTVNKRILMLKTELSLNDIEFCGRASISTATLYKVKNDEEISQRVLNSIISGFNVNKDWLLHGKGKMFADAPKEVASANPWKDEAYFAVKEENSVLKKELERLWQLLQHNMGGAKPNFLKATDAVNMLMFPSKKQFVGAQKHNSVACLH